MNKLSAFCLLTLLCIVPGATAAQGSVSGANEQSLVQDDCPATADSRSASPRANNARAMLYAPPDHTADTAANIKISSAAMPQSAAAAPAVPASQSEFTPAPPPPLMPSQPDQDDKTPARTKIVLTFLGALLILFVARKYIRK